VRTADELREAAEWLGYPLVVKPVDSQSSRGVHRVDAPAALPAALEDALRSSRQEAVLAEEFLRGTEATVEAFVVDGQVITLGISDKQHYPHRPEVACRLTYPPAFPADTVAAVASLNERIIAVLGLRDGVTHAEYMVDGADVRLVEIAARGGGSRIHTHIAPYLGGIDVPRALLAWCVGMPRDLSRTPGERAANLEFFSFAPGRVTRIEGVDEARALPGVAEILLEFEVGSTLAPPDNDRARPGLMVVLARTRDEVLSRSAEVRRLVRVDVAEGVDRPADAAP
jgi:carbamoyl-phosphate synthase large subunit